MNDRILELRKSSLEAVNRISSERAELLTEFMQSTEAENHSVPVKRALAFKYLLEKKKIWIGENELIVGERGPAPKATPTYPEVCLHTVDDLEILDAQEKVSFKSDEKVKEAYLKNIIPYWKGKTQRDRLFDSMEPEWIKAYKSGVFTEFQEQRAPGHTVLGDKIYKKGFLDLIAEIDEKIIALKDSAEAETSDSIEELKAMKIAAEAMIGFARRHAMILQVLSMGMPESERKNEMLAMAAVCNNVPANAPEIFTKHFNITGLSTWVLSQS